MRGQTIKDREKQSADAYLSFLQSKGASSRTLYLRSRFLDSLMVELKGKEQNRLNFAKALKTIRVKLPKDELSLALSTSREYFAFWMEDIKGIADFEKKYGFNISTSEWHPKPKTLKALKNAVETDIFTNDETACLKNYTDKMLRTISDVAVVDQRTKYAKILLVRLRDAPSKSHLVYRIAVDMTMNLFKDQNIQQLYLDAARDFYKFWRAKPNAYT